MTIERYCTCGMVLKIDAPKRRANKVLSIWYAEHSGDGHADTSAAGAEAARMGTGTGMGRETARKEGRG